MEFITYKGRVPLWLKKPPYLSASSHHVVPLGRSPSSTFLALGSGVGDRFAGDLRRGEGAGATAFRLTLRFGTEDELLDLAPGSTVVEGL